MRRKAVVGKLCSCNEEDDDDTWSRLMGHDVNVSFLRLLVSGETPLDVV